MKRLLPQAFHSPPFPASVPSRIARPPPHPTISPKSQVLRDPADLVRVRNAAGIAASARLLADRIVHGNFHRGQVGSYLRLIISDEYVRTLHDSNGSAQSSVDAYIDQLMHSPLTTHALDLMLASYLVHRGAYPSGVGFMGFPRAVCTSVNEVIAHGVPDLRPLQEGDILNVDLTCYFDGMFGDCSGSFAFGTIGPDSMDLLSAPRMLVMNSVQKIKCGMTLFDLASLMDEERQQVGTFTCVPYFCGHGIGRHLHEKPNIFHTTSGLDEDVKLALKQETLKSGQVITIEPILVEKGGDTKGWRWPDGWTWVTADGSRTAQHEEMILITDSGAEVITVPDQLDVGLSQ